MERIQPVLARMAAQLFIEAFRANPSDMAPMRRVNHQQREGRLLCGA